MFLILFIIPIEKKESTFSAVCLLEKENTSFKAFAAPSYLFLSKGFDHELYIPAQHEILNSRSSIPFQLPKQRNEFEHRKIWVYSCFVFWHVGLSTVPNLPFVGSLPSQPQSTICKLCYF